jgi:hypothetical protein
MIQFNKELYDTGKYDVVYRNGEKVKDLAFFKDGTIVSKSVKGSIHTHIDDGRWTMYKGSDHRDLFLIPKERWANLYKSQLRPFVVGPYPYSSKEEGEQCGIGNPNYIETVKLVSDDTN